MDQDINLTYVLGGQSVEALDLTLCIEPNGTISTKLYKKPLEGSQFIHWKSNHTLATNKSILYAQLLRLKRHSTFQMTTNAELPSS